MKGKEESRFCTNFCVTLFINGLLLVSGVWKKSWEENVWLWRNQVAIELGVKEGCPLVHSLKIGKRQDWLRTVLRPVQGSLFLCGCK